MSTVETSPDSWVSYVAYKLRPEYRVMPEAERFQLAAFLVEILESPHDRVDVDVFCSVGFRADTDFFIRYVGPTPEELQEICVKVSNSGLGRYLDISHDWMAHIAPGDRPKVEDERSGAPYFVVYPLTMQPAWFAMPQADRAELVKEHKALMAEFAEVEVNVARSFGLGEQEWVFGCEVHNMARYEAMHRKLRASSFNEFVLLDSPPLVGTCVSAHEALELCGAL